MKNEPLPTVSIITRCKGRLKHLKKTLRLMLQQDYLFTEIIVVNYSSPDGLHDWLYDKWLKQTQIGRLIEAYVPDKDYFHHAHSRNIGLRAAQGDYVLFLDADVQASTSLVSHLIKRLRKMDRIFAMVGDPVPPDCSGTLFAKRKDLMDLNGFQEHFEAWGYEDGDMRDRLFLYNREMFSFNPKFVSAVIHPDYERFMYFDPPHNKQSDDNWSRESKKANYAKSREYIEKHGVKANKDTEWGQGGHVVNLEPRYLDRIGDPKQRVQLWEQMYEGMKGTYLIQWDPKTGECLNEHQLLADGMPRAYLEAAKKKRKEGFKHTYDIKDFADPDNSKKIKITPEQLVVDDPEDARIGKVTHISNPNKNKRKSDPGIIVEVDDEDK